MKNLNQFKIFTFHKKSLTKQAVQVGLSIGLISLAAGNPTPSFGMDDTEEKTEFELYAVKGDQFTTT